MSWNSPDSGNYDSDITLGFDPSSDISNNNDFANVTVKYDGPNSDGFVYSSTDLNSNSDSNHTFDFSVGDPGYGSYDFVGVAFDTNSNVISETNARSFTLDGEPPSLTINRDSEFVAEDPTIEVEFQDQYTDVTSASASADSDVSVSSEPDSVDCNAGETCTYDYELDTSDIDSGDSFEFTVEANDSVGNTGSDSRTLELDTSYEGDTEPDLEWDTTVNDDYVLMDEDVELTLTYDDQDENPATARCFDGETDDDDNEIDEGEVNDLEAVCEFDEDDFADGEEIDLKVQSCDEAGNCETYEAGTYSFDKNDPNLESVSSEASAVNSDFDVSFEASDSSGLQEAEYFFEATVETGEGTSVDVDSDSDDVSSSLTVDTSDMETGEDRTVYFRVKDSAGRWSNIEQVEVDYFPDASADLTLSVPESVDATATKSSTMEFTVENNGKVPAEDVEVSFSGLVSDSVTVSELLTGASETLTWSFTPEKSDIGEKEMEVSLKGYDAKKTVKVRVKASSSQQESISSKLSTYQKKLEGLKSNTSSLNSKLGQKLSERLKSNVSSFESSIEDADQAISSGEYYKAQEILSDIDTEYSSARDSYQEVEDQYQSNQRRTMILAGVGVFVLLLLGGGAFAYREGVFDEYDLDSGLGSVAGKVEDLDVDFGGSEGDGEDSSDDEFAWDGFN